MLLECGEAGNWPDKGSLDILQGNTISIVVHHSESYTHKCHNYHHDSIFHCLLLVGSSNTVDIRSTDIPREQFHKITEPTEIVT